MGRNASAVVESLDRRLAHSIWRGDAMGLARAQRTLTGFFALDKELPDGGWPASSLIELLVQQAGAGEMRLLRPALQTIAKTRRVLLVDPPHPPQTAAWQSWGLPAEHIVWIKAQRVADALWSAEQILKNGAVGALLLWQKQVWPEALRRLQLAAQGADSTCWLLRPLAEEIQPSPAPLRLAIRPASGGVSVHIVKRRGPVHEYPIELPFEGIDTSLPPRVERLRRREA